MAAQAGKFKVFEYNPRVPKYFHLTSSQFSIQDMRLGADIQIGAATQRDGQKYQLEIKMGTESFIGRSKAAHKARSKAYDKLFHYLICKGDQRLERLKLFKDMRVQYSPAKYIEKMVGRLYNLRKVPNCLPLPPSLASSGCGANRKMNYAKFISDSGQQFVGQDPIFDKAREDLYKNVLLVWMGVKPYSQPPPDFAQLLIGDAGAGPSGDVGLPGRGRGRGGGRTGAGPYSGLGLRATERSGDGIPRPGSSQNRTEIGRPGSLQPSNGTAVMDLRNQMQAGRAVVPNGGLVLRATERSSDGIHRPGSSQNRNEIGRPGSLQPSNGTAVMDLRNQMQAGRAGAVVPNGGLGLRATERSGDGTPRPGSSQNRTEIGRPGSLQPSNGRAVMDLRNQLQAGRAGAAVPNGGLGLRATERSGDGIHRPGSSQNRNEISRPGSLQTSNGTAAMDLRNQLQASRAGAVAPNTAAMDLRTHLDAIRSNEHLGLPQMSRSVSRQRDAHDRRCWRYARNGWCKDGDYCRFEHF